MNAMEWFFLVVVVLISLVVLVTNFYILVYFSHPEDSFTKGIWVYRIIVVRAAHRRSASCPSPRT